MPEHDLLLQINDKVGTILTELGGMRSDIRTQNTRIDCIDGDNEARDRKIEELTRFANEITKERKVAMFLGGVISAIVYITLAILTYLFRR